MRQNETCDDFYDDDCYFFFPSRLKPDKHLLLFELFVCYVCLLVCLFVYKIIYSSQFN